MFQSYFKPIQELAVNETGLVRVSESGEQTLQVLMQQPCFVENVSPRLLLQAWDLRPWGTSHALPPPHWAQL